MGAFFALTMRIFLVIASANGVPLSLSFSSGKPSFHHRSLMSINSSQIPFQYARQDQLCTITRVEPDETRKVLQINGTADDVVNFLVCPVAADTPLPQLNFESASSSGEVLQTSDPSDIELQIITSDSCVNVTALFSFESMVGTTVYTLTARSQVSGNSLCTGSVRFLVAGLTVFEEADAPALSSERMTNDFDRKRATFRISRARTVPSDDNPSMVYIIRSGVSSGVVLDYRDILDSEVIDLNIKIQFPDGTDSRSLPLADVGSALRGARLETTVDATSPIRFDNDDCFLASGDISTTLKEGSGCGAALGIRESPIFGVRYEPYRDGDTDFVIDWPSFSADDDTLSEESFSNVIQFSIIGDPPPLVDIITMPDAIYRAGGQEITVVYDNSDKSKNRTLQVGDMEFPEIPGSYRRLPNGLYESKFRTLPGTGTEIPWKVNAYEDTKVVTSKVVKEDVKQNVSYVTAPISIGELEPPFGNASQEITLDGFFDGFDPNRDGHDIYIGEKSIAELGIKPSVRVEGNQTRIVLTAPSREVAGSAYNYPIRVVVNNETTSGKLFSYVPVALQVGIEVIGGSFDSESQEYVLGECEASRYIVKLPSGAVEPESILWNMTTYGDGSSADILSAFPDIEVRNRILTLPVRVFSGTAGTFALAITCVLYGKAWDAMVKLRKASYPVIGLALSRVPPRNLALPNFPLRVDAIVTLPEGSCMSLMSEVVYEWTFSNIKRSFSWRNATQFLSDDNIRPTRLGRELVISQSALRYGNLSISLFAYVKGDPSIAGNASTIARVIPAELIAVIGFGASKVLHGVSSDLEMIGSNSVSPDDVLDNSLSIVRYEWQCEMSVSERETVPDQQCPMELLPLETDSSFTVSADDLKGVRDFFFSGSEKTPFYIKYSLRVGTNSTWSSYANQIVEIIQTSSAVASLTDLKIVNGRNTSINWERIRFYDDIAIVPHGNNILWSFLLLSPVMGARLFNSSDSFMVTDGYYNPNVNISQPFPLGIKAGTLKPAHAYEILLSLHGKDLFGRGLTDGAAVLRIRTVDRPKLMLPPLELVTGNVDTLFSASARVNLDSESPFSYFFFLVTQDKEEICLDGCSGRETVQFRVMEVGTFRVLVRLRDVEGTSVLDEQFYTENITIISSTGRTVSTFADGTELNTFDQLLRGAYRHGDHGAVNSLASALSRQVRRQWITDDVPMIAMERLSLAIGYVNTIVRNSVPTALTVRGYIQTASHFARLPPALFPNASTLFLLLSIVESAIVQVPLAEAVDSENDLLMFFNLSMRHAISPFANKLIKEMMVSQQWENSFESAYLSSQNGPYLRSSVDSDDQKVLIDMFASMQKLLTLALSRDALCGSIKQVNTIVPNGISYANDIPSTNRTSPSYGYSGGTFKIIESFRRIEPFPFATFSTFSIAVVCQGAQVRHLQGRVSKFKWCGDDFLMEWEPVESPEYTESPEPIVPTQPPHVSPEPLDSLAKANSRNVVPRKPLAVIHPSISNIRVVPQLQEEVLASPAPEDVFDQKRLFVMMETLDYIWMSGLIDTTVERRSPVLVTTNSTLLNGTGFRILGSPLEHCYSVNTSIPRLGFTEDSGCLSTTGFAMEKRRQKPGQPRWKLTRNYKDVKTTMAMDSSSTALLQSDETGIVGTVGKNCPINARIPKVSLPEEGNEFSYTLIGVTVSVTAGVYVAWMGSSASYATFAATGVVS